MSEYQYYEFSAIDRPLGDHELAELRALSKRARITRSSFVNVYHRGDLRGDPRTLMERYFDAFLYSANWGTRELMFRVPRWFFDSETVQRYCDSEVASAQVSGEHVILAFVSEDEEQEFEDLEGGEGWLASLVPARAELVGGDRRLLYLAWLLSVQAGEFENDETEPPVPEGMAALSASLHSVAEFLRIDEDLLAAAAAGSAPVEPSEQRRVEQARRIEQLPTTEKDTFLLQLLQGEGARVRAELQNRFAKSAEAADGAAVGTRTVGELLDAAHARRVARQRRVEREREQERVRREREEVAAREQRPASRIHRCSRPIGSAGGASNSGRSSESSPPRVWAAVAMSIRPKWSPGGIVFLPGMVTLCADCGGVEAYLETIIGGAVSNRSSPVSDVRSGMPGRCSASSHCRKAGPFRCR